jgi:hypothetical protein
LQSSFNTEIYEKIFTNDEDVKNFEGNGLGLSEEKKFRHSNEETEIRHIRR